MASTSLAFLGFLFILLVSLASNVVSAGRNIPTDDKAADDVKHPEWLGHFDGTVLVPGLGRFRVPKKGSHVNPFTYNPITGTNTGNGAIIPGIGGGSTGGNSYVPGGDDTLLPNPGVEVPNPAGGGLPAPSTP